MRVTKTPEPAPIDNNYPRMLYRFPAQSPDPAALQDGKYDTCEVEHEGEHSEQLAAGWHETPGAARAASQAAAAAAPTRSELEQKAKELGLPYKPTTTNKALGDMIAAKLVAG